jgi:predicted nucleotide-binding protein
MPKTILFIGSSAAANSQARALVRALTSDTLEFLPWWDAFTPGKTLLEELDSIHDKVDGALLVFSPEAQTVIRKDKKFVPNLNVLFEFGYFYGHFGKQKVAMIKYGDFFLPSDFGGYIWITGSKFFKRRAVVQVGQRTKTDFKKWVQQL